MFRSMQHFYQMLSHIPRRFIMHSIGVFTFGIYAKYTMSRCSNISIQKQLTPEDAEVVRVIEAIKNISDKQILEYGRNIGELTKMKFIDDPMACGTFADSLFQIIPKIRTTSQQPITNILFADIYTFMEHLNDNDEQLMVQFGIFSKDLSIEDVIVHFCGHAFTIIKLSKNKYIFTQSYIGVYKHNECVQEKTFEEVCQIIKNFILIVETQIIDDEFVRSWKQITNVNANIWKGCTPINNDNSFSFCILKMSF